MSGIVGFINLDHEPADSEILLKVCQPLQGRAPDDSNTWQRGSTGLGHALLATSADADITSQPHTLDGTVWVTSDAHLCGKKELIQKLRSAGAQIAADVCEPDLLLWAYRTFGEVFARHLVGDFAVAIWDEQQKKLVCVRDHLGVRPLYYAHTSEIFVFSSDINAILVHPKVNNEINDEYIADFLMFSSSIEREATAYKHIKRLPAAHYMTIDTAGIRLHEYWSPPLHQAIRYSHPSEYTEHFASLFEDAVTERIPSTQVAVDLSGGMDSSSIAAVTAAHARENGQQVTAYTNSCQALIAEDKEGNYARLIAAHLGIPVQIFASEDYPLFDRFDSPVLQTAEPFPNPGLAQYYDKVQKIISSGSRVLLTGQMGDVLFAGSITYFPHLLKTGRWIQFLSDAYVHRRNAGSLAGTGLRAMIEGAVSRFKSKKYWQPDRPGWINPDFAARTRLEERWHAIWQMWGELNDTHGQLLRPWFSTQFDSFEALRLPLVVRHPFSDIRLVEFMLRAPNYMHNNKRVLREAMRDRLPPEIVSRPKEGLPGDLQKAKMRTGLCRALPSFRATDNYIDSSKYSLAYEHFLEAYSDDSTWPTWLVNFPIALAYWMNNNNK
jgi:asparagine synthase (glutamine-hydrolysing)